MRLFRISLSTKHILKQHVALWSIQQLLVLFLCHVFVERLFFFRLGFVEHLFFFDLGFVEHLFFFGLGFVEHLFFFGLSFVEHLFFFGLGFVEHHHVHETGKR